MKIGAIMMAATMMVSGFIPAHAKDNNTTFLNSVDNTEEIQERSGMLGRLYIPDANVNVALFYAEGLSIKEVQLIVDAEDSAAWQQHAETVAIGDHGDQEFIDLNEVIPNETLCYIQNGAEVTIYICSDFGVGQNVKKDLLDKNGNSMTHKTDISFLTYCCADETGKNIYYAYWVPYAPGDIVTDTANALEK